MKIQKPIHRSKVARKSGRARTTRRSKSTRCYCTVTSVCLVDPPTPVVGHLPPNPTPKNSTHASGKTGPSVVFIPCKFGDAWRFKSSDELIRICVSLWKGLIRFDADWFSTDLELAPQAGDAIRSRWTAELGLYPKGRRGADCGGLKSCLILDVTPGRELHWRRFLRRLLSDRGSWWYFDSSVMDFCPPSVTAPDTSSGNQP
jgi:hypothetical protein